MLHPFVLTRQSIFVIVVIVGLTLLFFQRITFTGMIMGRGDAYTYFYPYWDIRSAAFRAGEVPLWSPAVFMGVPLLANSQLGTFYPPNWLVTPFAAPTAVAYSLVAHTAWAICGMYVLARRRLYVDRIPALLAGVLFGLGGYLGGQSEHINQLQALSWLPWIFWAGSSLSGNQSPVLRRVTGCISVGMLVAIQLLAGHPQTVFITLAGLAIYLIAVAFTGRQSTSFVESGRRLLTALILLAISTLIAILLAVPQLVPTLELATLSNRSGGLQVQKVLAFSFPPLLIGRGLLPSYDGLVFGEYIAYVGVIGLGLAIIGILNRRSATETESQHPTSTPYLILLIVAFLLALGAYNPLNWLLANIPGFSFFRVPARWLALLAFSLSLLAGVGLHSLKFARPRWWVLLLSAGVVVGLASASLLAGKAAEDVIGPAVPTIRTWAGWGSALLVLLVLVWFGRRIRYAAPLLGLAGVVELLLASQIMPFNQVVPEDIYSASRFTIRQLQVYAEDQTPPGRYLSITPLEFDPGDVENLKTRYDELGMSEFSTRVALVATKMREVVAPNLALTWGLEGVDGFDGGLLPTGYYSTFSALLVPPDETPTTDGRLREILAEPSCRGACIPDQRWLNLTNTRYLITDKTADVVRDGIFYDTTFTVALDAGKALTIRDIQPFQATAIDLLYTCAAESCQPPDMNMLTEDGNIARLSFASEPVAADTFTLTRYRLDNPAIPTAITITSTDALSLRALTLVDTRVTLFQQVTLPPWQRVLSSDIKLYENQKVLPRAFVVQQTLNAADDEAALNLMRDLNFDPATSAVLATTQASSGSATADVSVTEYSPERMEIRVTGSTADSWLVMTDPYYPGWTATVNGQPTLIERTDIMFRAVPVPADDSTVVLEYRPAWWPGVLWAGVGLWFGAVGMLWWGRRKQM